ESRQPRLHWERSVARGRQFALTEAVRQLGLSATRPCNAGNQAVLECKIPGPFCVGRQKLSVRKSLSAKAAFRERICSLRCGPELLGWHFARRLVRPCRSLGRGPD